MITENTFQKWWPRRAGTGPGQFAALALAMMWLFLALRAGAQDRVTHFNAPEFYPPPHETQKKSLISGDEGIMQPDGKIMFKVLKVETFRQNGDRDLIVEAPECLYDPDKHEASSSGRIKIRNGAGTFFLEGTGFHWQQSNSTLVISNQVHTILHPATNTEPIK